MKRIIRPAIALVVLLIALSSCEDPILPSAEFSFSPTDVEIYDEVTFTNLSSDADTYSWSFGDGGTSTDETPVHSYTSEGTYTVSLTATNIDGSKSFTLDVVVTAPANVYTLDDVEFAISADMFWYQSSMGGDPYIRLLTPVSGQDNPDLLKLYPNSGVNELPGTYTWDAAKPEGTYDFGYTADYAGMQYAWTSIGITGSQNLVITELATDVYKIELSGILELGAYDYANGGVWVPADPADKRDVELFYIGAITPTSK